MKEIRQSPLLKIDNSNIAVQYIHLHLASFAKIKYKQYNLYIYTMTTSLYFKIQSSKYITPQFTPHVYLLTGCLLCHVNGNKPS